MEKFVLPDKWVVKALTDEEDEVIVKYINKTFDTKINEGLNGNEYWYYSNIESNIIPGKHDGSGTKKFLDAIEISYNEFENYVLNKINEPCEHDPELEIILKRLLEQ